MADRMDTAEAVGYGFDLLGFAVPLAVGSVLVATGLSVLPEALANLWTQPGIRGLAVSLLVLAVGWVFLLAGLGGALYKLRSDAGGP
jgi:hypothetical protein